MMNQNTVSDWRVVRARIGTLMQEGRYVEAEVVAQELMQQFPDLLPAMLLMGHILKAQQKYEAMVALGKRVCETYPACDDLTFMLQYAVALQRTGALKEAIYYHLKVIQLMQNGADHDNREAYADVLYNVGMAYDSLGVFDKASTFYDMALGQRPDYPECLFAREMLHIKTTDLKHDFAHYSTRFMVTGQAENRGYPCPRWQGESLAGKRLVVWSEQGIGDIVMFAGFIPYLLTQLSHLTLEVAPYLVAIFARSFPDVEVVAKQVGRPSDAVLERHYDYDAPMGDLLRLLAHYQPRVVQGYLKPDANRVAELKARYRVLSGRPVVGISWRTIQPDTSFRRNIPLELWAPILQVPEAQFVSLQYSGEQEELAYVKRTLGVDIHFDETVEPMVNRDDFFAQVAAMDAVVSIQNSTVHAGGAMGVPTLLMLSRSGDFRWGVTPSDSVWYPTVEILRQRDYGDWQPVLEQAGQWLQQRVAGGRI